MMNYLGSVFAWGNPIMKLEHREMIRVLSLGAGVQSTCLLLLSCRGELPKLDYAIFADTGWEPKAVYKQLEWLKVESAKHGIPVITVTAGNIRDDMLGNKRFTTMPFFITNPDGSSGFGRRQCSREYKIHPIETWEKRKILGLRPHQHAPKHPVIEQWMGITHDEAHRAKPSYERWKMHSFPFIDLPPSGYLDRMWRRRDCIAWLEENYPDISVPRSACIGCPFHSDKEWREIRAMPDEWDDAVDFDRKIRVNGKGEQFLHKTCKPLSEVDFRTDADKGQGELWGNECEGMCGM